jgi:hypothetical protein
MSEQYFDEKYGVWVTRLKPGKALGADDLQTWSGRRALGQCGGNTLIQDRRKIKKWLAKGGQKATRKNIRKAYFA